MQAIRLLCLNLDVDAWPLTAQDTAKVDGDAVLFRDKETGSRDWTFFRRVEVLSEAIEDDRTVTREEFLAYHAENPNLIADFNVERREAIAQLAELGNAVSNALNEGSELAAKYGIEWIVETDHGSINVPRLNAVDWDSSSMYC